jgi:AraC family transcriptional regulator
MQLMGSEGRNSHTNRADAWSQIARTILPGRLERSQELEVSISRIAIEDRAAWSFREDHHTVFVHLSGELRKIEAVFERGLQTKALPSIGGVWMVPADCRYDVMISCEFTEFCEIRLPKFMPDGRALELGPLVNGRDHLLHQTALLFKKNTAANDDVSRMSRASLIEVARWQIIQRYGRAIPSLRDKERLPRKLPQAERSRLDSYIRDNLAERLALQDLAEIAKMSTHNFLKAFAASFGTTPAQYIIQTRVDLAKFMLQSTSRPITDIALATGFYSSSHFSASFTKHVGVAPAAYRRVLRD